MSESPDPTIRVRELRDRVHQALAPLVDLRSPVALVDFPRYANVGDSAIWAGAVRFLESHGIRPAYTCDMKTYDRETLASRIGAGTILLKGGGNFGDLYPPHQLLRERVIESFPDNPIVQLPQTIHFESREALDRARSVYNRHHNLTLLVRDQRSLETVGTEFRCPSVLCPDMAYCLGPLPRQVKPSAPVVWLMRDDMEATTTSEAPPEDWRDWNSEGRSLALRLYIWLTGATRRSAVARNALHSPVRALRWRLSQQRLACGCAMLSEGRVVVTDRLHGHILCSLLNIPHVLLDNSYGKNRDFFDTWADDGGLTSWADSVAEARALAREIMPA